MMAASATAVAMVVARLMGEVSGEVRGVVGGKVSSVLGGYIAVFFAWCLHTVGIIQTCIGINLFWSKLEKNLFGMAGHVQ
jgi:hypothetical protein